MIFLSLASLCIKNNTNDIQIRNKTKHRGPFESAVFYVPYSSSFTATTNAV